MPTDIDAYDQYKNGRNKNFHYGFRLQRTFLDLEYSFNERFDADKHSLAELHAEEMRVMKDMKLRSGRTGVSASHIRYVSHHGCDVGAARCPYHRKRKKMNTFKHSKSDVNKMTREMIVDA